MKQTTQFNYYYYSEDNNSSLLPKFIERNIASISALAYKNGLPVQKAISRLAFRGQHSKKENVFYFVLSECYPSTVKAIKCCLMFNRYCVVFIEGKRLEMKSFDSADYAILDSILKERKNAYIDKMQREENLKIYLMRKGIAPSEIKRHGLDSLLFAPLVKEYHSKEYTSLLKNLCYYFDIPVTIASERDPMEQWANTLQTTYAPHDLVEEYYIVEDETISTSNIDYWKTGLRTLKVRRIEEIKSTPEDIFYKPRQENNPVEIETNRRTVACYLENSIQFSKQISTTYTLPNSIKLHNEEYQLPTVERVRSLINWIVQKLNENPLFSSSELYYLACSQFGLKQSWLIFVSPEMFNEWVDHAECYPEYDFFEKEEKVTTYGNLDLLDLLQDEDEVLD